MSLPEEMEAYEAAKRRIVPSLIQKRYLAPIFEAEGNDSPFAVDGFFLNQRGGLTYLCSGNLWEDSSGPLDIYKAFNFFRQNLDISQALRTATEAIDKCYVQISSPTTSSHQ